MKGNNIDNVKINGKVIDVDNIKYEDKSILITLKNNWGLNISFKDDISLLGNCIKKDVSKDIYYEINFYTDRYSYCINVDKGIYITRMDNNSYLLELNLPSIDIVIPPFDKVKEMRINLSSEEIEIKNLEINAYFKLI